MDSNSQSSSSLYATDTSSQPVSNPPPPHKHTPKSRKGSKPYGDRKPRYNKPSAPIRYAVNPIPATLSTHVTKVYHRIHTQTNGIQKFAGLIYEIYASRDTRLQKAFSKQSLEYVSILALTDRIFTIGNEYGYAMTLSPWKSRLRDLVQSLCLPDPIAKYIESVGRLDMSNGIALVPYVPTVKQLLRKPQFYADLKEYVHPSTSEDDGEYAPLLPEEQLLGLLSLTLVSEYMLGAAQGAKFGALFRRVNQGEIGSPLFGVSFRDDNSGYITGYCCESLELAQAQLGACYRLRSLNERNSWLGDNDDYRPVQQTSEFAESVFVIDKVVNTLMFQKN